METKIYNHGEAIIASASIPSNAKPLKQDKLVILAESETHGKFHVIENVEGCEFYELDGVRYMRNTEPTKVRMRDSKDHHPIEIPAGEWEFDIQQEYDHLTQQANEVRD